MSHIPLQQQTSVPCCFSGDVAATVGICVNHWKHILGYSLNDNLNSDMQEEEEEEEDEEEEGGGWHWCTINTRTINPEIPEGEGELAVVQKTISQFTTNRKQTERHRFEQSLLKTGLWWGLDPLQIWDLGNTVSLLFPPRCVFEVGSLGLCGAHIKFWSHCILLRLKKKNRNKLNYVKEGLQLLVMWI